MIASVELGLGFAELTCTELRALALSSWAQLKQLALDHNPIGFKGARDLLEADVLPGLVALAMRNCDISSSGKHALKNPARKRHSLLLL